MCTYCVVSSPPPSLSLSLPPSLPSSSFCAYTCCKSRDILFKLKSDAVPLLVDDVCHPIPCTHHNLIRSTSLHINDTPKLLSKDILWLAHYREISPFHYWWISCKQGIARLAYVAKFFLDLPCGRLFRWSPHAPPPNTHRYTIHNKSDYHWTYRHCIAVVYPELWRYLGTKLV